MTPSGSPTLPDSDSGVALSSSHVRRWGGRAGSTASARAARNESRQDGKSTCRDPPSPRGPPLPLPPPPRERQRSRSQTVGSPVRGVIIAQQDGVGTVVRDDTETGTEGEGEFREWISLIFGSTSDDQFFFCCF